MKPDLIFLSETKRNEDFVRKICQKLGWEDRWKAVDPIGRSKSMLVGWELAVFVYLALKRRLGWSSGRNYMPKVSNGGIDGC